jgi:hypothetical protein
VTVDDVPRSRGGKRAFFDDRCKRGRSRHPARLSILEESFEL